MENRKRNILIILALILIISSAFVGVFLALQVGKAPDDVDVSDQCNANINIVSTTAPANGSSVNNRDIAVSWTSDAYWGADRGCTQKYYAIYVQPNCSEIGQFNMTNAATVFYQDQTHAPTNNFDFGRTSYTFNIPFLMPETNYCLGIRRGNGYDARTRVSTFITTGATCGDGICSASEDGVSCAQDCRFQCSDKVDNDSDGQIDQNDVACMSTDDQWYAFENEDSEGPTATPPECLGQLETVTVPINFPATPAGCDFSRGMRNSFQMGFKSVSQPVVIPDYDPEEVTLCSMDLQFPNQRFQYDDSFTLTLSDAILMTSLGGSGIRPSGIPLFESLGRLKLYDFEKIFGFAPGSDVAWCADNTSDPAVCRKPVSEQVGQFRLQLSDSIRRELIAYALHQEDLNFYLHLTGDNNPSIDCSADPLQFNAIFQFARIVTEDADANIEKTAAVTAPGINSSVVSYTIQVTNPTGIQVTDVSVTDTLPNFVNPGDLEFTSQPAGTFNNGNKTITWQIGTMEPGQTVNITYNLRVARANYGSAITNTAIVFIDDEEVDRDSVDITLNSSNLVIVKSGSVIDIDSSQAIIDYTLQAANPNNFAVNDIIVVDTLPNFATAGMVSNISNGGTFNPTTRQITWNFNTLQAGQVVNLTYRLTVPSANFGNVFNEAEIFIDEDGDNQPDPNESQDEDDSSIDLDPDLGANVTKSHVESTVSGGGLIANYTIVAQNVGEANLVNLTVTDSLPSGILREWVQNISSGGSIVNDVLTWPNINIDIDESVTFTYTVVFPAGTSGVFNNVVVVVTPGNNVIAEDEDIVVIVPPTPPGQQPSGSTGGTTGPGTTGGSGIPATNIFDDGNRFILFGMIFILSGLLIYRYQVGREFILKLTEPILARFMPYEDKVERAERLRRK